MKEHSRASNKFVPIDELHSSRLSFDVGFPNWVPVQRIGVHVSRINRLLRIGGIRHLSVTGSFGSETSSTVPMIVGINEQGSAYAAKAKSDTIVPTHREFDLPDNRGFKPHRAQWIDGQVNLNLDEIAQRIRQSNKWGRDVRSEKAWSSYLDQSVREGIVKPGSKHLTDFNLKLAAQNYTMSYGVFLVTDFVLSQADGNFSPLNDLIKSSIYIGTLSKGLERLFSNFDPVDPEFGYRFSFIRGPEYDRALLLKFTSKTRLIKQIPQQS